MSSNHAAGLASPSASVAWSTTARSRVNSCAERARAKVGGSRRRRAGINTIVAGSDGRVGLVIAVRNRSTTTDANGRSISGWLLDQSTERVGREPEQIGVADRIHRRRTILVGDHGHLADDFALADLADHDLAAVGVGDRRPQPAVADDVQALGRPRPRASAPHRC